MAAIEKISHFGIRPDQNGFDLASKAVLVTLAAVILLTFKQYGVTWDEPIQHFYGRMVGRYYYALLHGQYDTNVLTFELTKYYGGLFDTLAALVVFVSPFRLYETRHLLNAIVGFVGVIGCWKAARLIGGPRAGFWAVLLLALTPRYYGPMFNNPKDIPFAAGYIWSLYYLLRTIPHLPRVPWNLTIKLAIAVGLTLGVRVGGLLLLCYVALVLAIWAAWRARTWSVVLYLARFGVSVTAIAWAQMLIWCPWAHTRPLTSPIQALASFTRDYPWFGSVLFDGQIVKAAKEPRTYLLRWFSITLPEIVLVLLAAGSILAIAALTRKHTYSSPNFGRYWLLAFATGFPIIYALLQRPVLYDGERHFLYVTPVLVCIAALTFSHISCLLPDSNSFAWIVALSIMAACLVYQFSVMVRLHPNEYVYFNQTVGGLNGAYGRFDTDYWGNSYREAVRDLTAYVDKTEPKGLHYTVMTPSKRESASEYFPPNFSYTKKPEEADFIIAITRDRLHEMLDGRVILTVKRMGVPLAFVKDRRTLKGIPVKGWPPFLMTPE